MGFFPFHFSYAWQISTAVDEGIHYKLVEKGDQAYLHLFAEKNESRLFLTYEKQGSSFRLVYRFLNSENILFRSGGKGCASRTDVFDRLRDVKRNLGVDLASAQCTDFERRTIETILKKRNEILPLDSEEFRSCVSAISGQPDLDAKFEVWNSGQPLPLDFKCPSVEQEGFYVKVPRTIGLSRELLARNDPLRLKETLQEEFLHWLAFEDDRVINECVIPGCLNKQKVVSSNFCPVFTEPDRKELESSNRCRDGQIEDSQTECIAVYSAQASSKSSEASQSQTQVSAQVPSAVQIAALQSGSPRGQALQGAGLLQAAVGAFRGNVAFADTGRAVRVAADGSDAVQSSRSLGSGRGPASLARGSGARVPLKNVTEPRSQSQQNFQATVPSLSRESDKAAGTARGPASAGSDGSGSRGKTEVSSAVGGKKGTAGRSGSRLVGNAGSSAGAESAFNRLPSGLASSLPPTAEQVIRRLESTVQNSSLERVEEQLLDLSSELSEAGITVYTPGDGRRFGAARGQVWFRIDSEGRLVDVTPRR